MKSHGEIYRVAFEAAQANLAEITAEFEKLRVRKEHVERLIVVLKPILGEAETTAPAARSEEVTEEPKARVGGSASESTSEAKEEVEASNGANSQPLGVGADPFQRRVEHVLGIGAGIRDVRQYTRQF